MRARCVAYATQHGHGVDERNQASPRSGKDKISKQVSCEYRTIVWASPAQPIAVWMDDIECAKPKLLRCKLSLWHPSCILFRKYGVAFGAVAVIQGIETCFLG